MAYLVLPNLPFWIAANFLTIFRRGWIDIDYAVWGIASFYAPRSFVVAGLSVSCILDIFRSSASTYYFSENDLLSSAVFALQWNWVRLALIVAVISTGCVAWSTLIVTFAPARERPPVKPIVILPLFLILAFVGIDIVSGANQTFRTRDSQSKIQLASAATFSFAKVLASQSRFGRAHVGFRSVGSATGPLLKELRGDVGGSSSQFARHNIVLIIVESYGSMLNTKAASQLASPYSDETITQRYSVSSGEVKFHGSTVPGEFRELCGMSVSVGTYPHDFSTCLPNLLRQRGYETASFHGFTGHMFLRESWYPRIGFTESLFLEQIEQRPGMRHCPGLFLGACDEDVARMIGDRLVSHSNRLQFIYWVTLNSHLPVERSKATDGESGCGSANASVSDIDVCTWMALVIKVNRAVAEMARRPDLPPTEFIVAGDHAPPFLSRTARTLFSQEVVPYFWLIPREKDEGLQGQGR